MARGFSQKEGEDYEETFAPITRISVHREATRFCDLWKVSHVFKVKKYLYGLTQAPKAWYARINNYLMSLGFTKSDADSNLYYKVEDVFPFILVLYVDDLC